MKRFIIFLLLGVLAVTGSQAQVVRSGAKALRSVSKTASTSGKVIRNLQQQSWRAGQAAREAVAVSRLKIKPIGVPIVIPDLDTDDQKRKNRNGGAHVRPATSILPSMKPLPEIKSYREEVDERITANYDSIKTLVASGAKLRGPYNLFQLADYAVRHNDEQFAIACLERVQTDRLSPKILEYVARRYEALTPYMPEMSRAVVVSAYCRMLDAKLKGTDCDSARMQHGDTLLMVTEQYNPALNPLVVLSCFYNPSKEVERYKEAADSVIATYNQWSPAFKDAFARDFMATLLDNEEHHEALSYFGKAPLKEFPDSQADFALYMATCAIVTQNDSLFTHYYGHALKLDSVLTENYWVQLHEGITELYVANPSQTELADWLIENHVTPADYAIDLSVKLVERYWPDAEFSWEWETIADDTPEQSTIRKAIIHILNKGESVDEARSNPKNAPYIEYLKAEIMMADLLMTPVAKTMLDELASTDLPDLRCRAIIGQAYIAAHGLDSPKEAMKILKKNIRHLDDKAVTGYTRGMWYEYMAALATRLGKTKEADKYLKLKETTNN